MNLSVGIVGLPNSGKSTLFNALLKKQVALVAEYPYTTIEPNVGVIEVPDERLGEIAQVAKIPKKVPAAIKFSDIAGLVKGANLGEGLGNQFLGHIREVDALLHVLRNFSNENVARLGSGNPEDDRQIVETELILADLASAQKLLENAHKDTSNQDQETIITILGSIVEKLQKGQLASNIPVPERLAKWKISLPLLTTKPVLYVLNVSESDIRQDFKLPFSYIKICAKLEAELTDLPKEEQREYLAAVGIDQSSLDQIILASYKLLELITFFTITGGKQAQAWPIKSGSAMIEAAAMVHTDFAKGFIKAEVISWDKLIEAGSRPEGRGSPWAAWAAAKEKGLIKTTGRDEKVLDGEVIEFKIGR